MPLTNGQTFAGYTVVLLLGSGGTTSTTNQPVTEYASHPTLVVFQGSNPAAWPQIHGLRVSTPGYFSDDEYQHPLTSGRCGR